MPFAQRLCRVEDIREGQARGFGPLEGYRRRIIVLRRNGTLHAWLDACPHYPAGTPMAWKTDAYLNGERTHIACHSHGALFDMETGECVLGPCLGQQLTRIALTINDEGDVFVRAAQEET
ncbi:MULTISPECIES: Rieske 2Fe-2S domain-containing protein [Pseudoxanthomonas]|uniref:Nitrite reductase/ring-hydroxylating ferredoxin subunit n=1 Tax=Pseudoxanthomonas winnipegensis TaxID=2480810 RepID=A0AAW8GF99_9GAMM|nr:MULTISPECIES: Rieske 2Fe-2S domain-containing protein [Pseudoxanthomonas]MDQ1120472.1 nitrite reductase/ring-hydroxylating ferredoxin subunit [Pseudoxanthomonas winnipegensis]MDQ1133691.1 nitrite reductase/ring-hydroxylating ferredoxin subunit [Pseudoxanthomonas winnipegensis]MDR6140068.1 nitrite reductase/ring-hydroxylating ferredoxin subunit [Pseudoxanthomonas sp. SORGH_AS_0997]